MKRKRDDIINRRELATVLAALRYWQQEMGTGALDVNPAESDIATDGGTLVPLNAEEIDAVCERLNQSQSKNRMPHVCDDNCRSNGCKSRGSY